MSSYRNFLKVQKENRCGNRRVRERIAPSTSEFVRQDFLGVWAEDGETIWVPGHRNESRKEEKTNGKKRNVRSLCACFINYNSFWFN